MVSLDGLDVLTIEGLKLKNASMKSNIGIDKTTAEGDKLKGTDLKGHEANRAMCPSGVDEVSWQVASFNGNQCGFCTPGEYKYSADLCSYYGHHQASS